MAEDPYNLQWATPFALKIVHGEIWTPSNTLFLGPTRVHNPNGTSIGSATFAELKIVTDRPIDHTTPPGTIGHIYVRSTTMQPNNSNQLFKTA